MTKEHARWAKGHDWYISYQYINNKLCVTVKDDMKAGSTLDFTSFKQLRDWAGY